VREREGERGRERDCAYAFVHAYEHTLTDTLPSKHTTHNTQDITHKGFYSRHHHKSNQVKMACEQRLCISVTWGHLSVHHFQQVCLYVIIIIDQLLLLHWRYQVETTT
jgi:hypothetical protein